MSLRVGINNNVLLNGASINDKGTLVLSFSQAGRVSDEDDMLSKVAQVKTSNVSNMMLFPVSVDRSGVAKEVKQIAGSLRGLREQLEHFLAGYLTTADATLQPYADIDTTNQDAFIAALGQQATVTKIYNNLTTQFIAKLNQIGQTRLNAEAFRLLLVRRSPTNHYGALRSMFIQDNPFWEPMRVPQKDSQLRFTKYEIGKGYDNGDPVAQTDADATDTTTGGSAADLILGQR